MATACGHAGERAGGGRGRLWWKRDGSSSNLIFVADYGRGNYSTSHNTMGRKRGGFDVRVLSLFFFPIAVSWIRRSYVVDSKKHTEI